MPLAKPFDLIAQFARYQEPHIRRNVTAALGVVGDDSAVALLTQMALTDADASVREAAEAELSQMDADDLDRLRRQLLVHVQSGDRQRAVGAMALIGRLRQRGLDLRETGDSPWASVRRIFQSERKWHTLRRVAAEQRERYVRLRPTYALRWRAWGVGLLGGAAVATLIAVYLRSTIDVRPDELQLYVGSASMAAALGLVFSTRRKVPMLFQWDPPASLMRDIVETALWSVLVIAVLATPFLRTADVGWWDTLALGVIAGALAAIGFAAVHVGSYLAINTWKSRFLAWLWVVIVGTGAGALVHTIVLWMVRLRVDNTHEAWLTEAVWLYALPASGGLALALSRIDAAPSTEPFARRAKSRRTRAAMMVAASATLLIALASVRYVGADESRVIFGTVNWRDVSGKPLDLTERVRRPLTVYRFVLPYAMTASFQATGENPTVLSLSYFPGIGATSADTGECERAAASQAISIETLTQHLQHTLTPGCYQVEARRGGPAISFDRALMIRSPFLRQQPESDQLVVRLNEDGAMFSDSTDKLAEGRVASWLTMGGASGRVRIESTRAWTLRVEAGPNGQLLTEPDRAETGWSLKLTTDDGRPIATGLPLRAALEKGRYLLEAAAPSAAPGWAYATFEAARQRMEASYSAIPVAFRFTQQSRGPVRVWTPQEGVDVVVQLWGAEEWLRRDGRPLAQGDDPPDTTTDLSPGDYVVTVYPYGGDTASAKQALRSPDLVVSVEGDLAGALQPVTRPGR